MSACFAPRLCFGAFDSGLLDVLRVKAQGELDVARCRWALACWGCIDLCSDSVRPSSCSCGAQAVPACLIIKFSLALLLLGVFHARPTSIVIASRLSTRLQASLDRGSESSGVRVNGPFAIVVACRDQSDADIRAP
eukprot:2905807-Rhodomonas_salina.1